MLWEFIKHSMLFHPGSEITEDNATMTYEEALIFAEGFASQLKGPCYAILCQSELMASLALLSCFAAGVTAVPLSYRYGEQHLRRILETMHPPFVITDMGGTLTVVDVDTGEYGKGSMPEPSPAVILCTSGTTGKPKGVMLSGKNLLTNVKDIQSYFSVEKKDKILIARPLYHCAVLTGEWLLALSKGMDIYFYNKPCNPAELRATICANGIAVMGGTPTLLQLLARFGEREDAPLPLKSVVVSGEPLGKQAACRIRKGFSNAKIYHVYGLTEASPRVAYLPPALFDTHAEWVGKPLPSVQVAILDGELCVKGDNVMLGYYNQPDLTRLVLRDGWLHTGDMAVMDENGLIQIKGRKDNMIIRAGMNLYPQELENALLADERVEEVLVYGIKDELWGQRIGLQIKGAFASHAEVCKLCAKVLPPYAQPSKVELVDSLPKNGSGKIVRGGKNNERI